MGPLHDFFSDVGIAKGIGAQTIAPGTVNGAGIDLALKEGVFACTLSALAVATGTLDVKVQISDDDGVTDAYADLSIDGNPVVFTQVTDAAAAFEVIRLNKREIPKRWMRFVAVGANANVAASVDMLYHPTDKLPVRTV